MPASHNKEEHDQIDSVCNQFDVDLETLYAHAAKHCTDVNKGKRMHWKPSKGSTLPLGDIWHMMADKKEIDINATKYSVKKANATSHGSNVTIDGVTYSINMAKLTIPMATYHVSTLQHSNKTWALNNHGANGGNVGADCHVIEEMHHFVSVKGIDNCHGEAPDCYSRCHYQFK